MQVHQLQVIGFGEGLKKQGIVYQFPQPAQLLSRRRIPEPDGRVDIAAPGGQNLPIGREDDAVYCRPVAQKGCVLLARWCGQPVFSLDGLGLLSFESVLNRDYPVVFATLWIFSLVGLFRR